MARRNWIVSIVGALRSPDDVLKPHADLVSWLGRDDGRRRRAGCAAYDGAAGRVVDGVVGGWHAQGGEGCLFCAVDGEFLRRSGSATLCGLPCNARWYVSAAAHLEKAMSLDACA